MASTIGEYLSAQFSVLDENGDGVTGLVPTTIASSDPLGVSFAVTYSELSGGAYFVSSDLPSEMAGNYTLFVSANDAVFAEGPQEYTITWDTDAASAVVTGIQRVQYVEQPHVAFDPNGTWDSRYFTKAEGEDAIGGLVDEKADITYVDAGLLLKADQTSLDQLAEDLADLTVDLTDMATETWVTAQLAGYSITSHNHDSRYYQESESDAFLAAKADDFTQYYAATIVIGDGVNVIQSTEPSVYFAVPEAFTLLSIEYRADVVGALTTNTAKAASGSASFTDIDGANPLAISTPATGVKTDLSGWTVSTNQFDVYRTNVPANATSITQVVITYRFSKGRA